MRELLKKTLLAAIGLICFGAGVYLTIQANIGVAPWDALNLGLSKTFGILYGTASVSSQPVSSRPSIKRAWATTSSATGATMPTELQSQTS